MSTKRITKEFAELAESPPEGMTVSLPSSSSIHTWNVTLRPQAPSAYHPGTYGLTLAIPTDYPFKPPTLKFVTRIYHPNITNDSLGNVCLAIAKPDTWKPSTKLAAVLESVRNLLDEPQPDDPLEERIAEEYRTDRAAWEKNVKIYVERYAMEEPVFPAA